MNANRESIDSLIRYDRMDDRLNKEKDNEKGHYLFHNHLPKKIMDFSRENG